MKILLIHSDGVEVEKQQEATTNPQEFEEKEIKMDGLVLVAYVSVEDQDTYDTDLISKQGADVIEEAILQISQFPEKVRKNNELIREHNRKVEKGEIKGNKRSLKQLVKDRSLYQVDKVLVYPWAHLSKFLSNDPEAMDVCPKIADKLEARGIEAAYSPFGWYKSFKVNCIGHELAEMYRDVKLYIQPEEHLESAQFKVLTPDREEIDIEFDDDHNPNPISEIENEDFHLFLKSELGGRRVDKGEEPAHI
ncbi:MAG: threonyl-tRNA synthetase editing domain-containing protein, partial [Promethearchaeota archaeon]